MDRCPTSMQITTSNKQPAFLKGPFRVGRAHNKYVHTYGYAHVSIRVINL